MRAVLPAAWAAAAAASGVREDGVRDVSSCCADNGKSGCKDQTPCKPGFQVCPPGAFGDHGSSRGAAQFHVRGLSCTLNDPNGPIYDPVHGVYHLHFQYHVGLHGGRTYGHAVSRDFAHWAHMPISIWNDQVYDESAIYTGSGTTVDGKVVQVYPGLCNTKDAGCPGGTNLCIAVPADPSDPLQTNWSKTWTQNPIVPNTGRDPSTAWKTSSGEWRLTTFDTQTFGSTDFKTWYRLGKTPGFAGGECPSFFPLPKTTPGAKVSASDPKPTHVHKASHGGDWMCVGTYTEGAANTTGSFAATPGITAGLTETKIDQGQFYASKDFYDPVKKRRINWGWATTAGPTQVQTMPREITWHPELQQLVYSPVEEQDNLRVTKIGSFSGALKTGEEHSLGLPKYAGNQSEVTVSFSRPSADATLGVKVMAGEGGPLPAPYAREMPNYDLSGGDYNVTDVDYKDFKTCEAECDRQAQCAAWTYVIRGPKYASCCLKSSVPGARAANGMTSGVKDPTHPASTSGTLFTVDYKQGAATAKVGGGGKSDTLKLLDSDTTIDVRLYMDNTFTEAYFQGGRVAMTVNTPATEASDISVSSSAAGWVETPRGGAPAVTATATAWSVGSIWVTPADVLRTPRLDGRSLDAWEELAPLAGTPQWRDL